MKKLLIIGLVGISLVSWCLTPIEAKSKEEIYQEKLAKLTPEDAKGHYELGRWCERNKFSEQAQELFRKTIELEPTHRDARRKLGHFKYKGKWISSEEMNARGLVKYKGKWVTYDKAMKAKGMVQFEGQWVTPSEKKKLEARARKMEALAKQFPFKGVLDKPGADHENLPWEKARVKETEHFIITTNLSMDALNDICFILECAYLNYQNLFGHYEQPKEKKLLVSVLKNREEYEKIYSDLLGTNPLPSSHGSYIPTSDRRNKSGQNHLLSYYRKKLTSMLLHECTHYALSLVMEAHNILTMPKWLSEGWTTYCEASRLEGKRLVTNVVHKAWLRRIKKIIEQQAYIKLKDFVNRAWAEYGFDICYPEGWSLVYFLLNGQEGKYKTGFQAYMEAWKKQKIVISSNGKNWWVQDKAAHLKLFEECMGVPIDQLEKEWKEYILSLKENKPK